MPSQKRRLTNNVNDSKNTRMDLDNSMLLMDFRKDEFMHLGRYFNACQTAIDMAKELNRPIRILDLGCGEIFIPRILYKSFVVKKSEIVQKYIGIDIDDVMIRECKDKFSTVMTALNVKLIEQDLTTNPTFKVKDGYFDLICWFENIEHMKPEFIPAIADEVARVLNPDTGVALVSTPNSNGSNSKLPKDHVYEWEYEELKELLENNFEVETVGIGVNMSKIPQDIRKSKSKSIEHVYKAFGRNTAFASVALAPMFPPKYCKNVLYICKKG